jgi:hypothetical protein
MPSLPRLGAAMPTGPPAPVADLAAAVADYRTVSWRGDVVEDTGLIRIQGVTSLVAGHFGK